MMNLYRHRFPRYGTVGLAVLLVMHTVMFVKQTGMFSPEPWQQLTRWVTPVCWWAYILVLDAWLFLRRGSSWLMDRHWGFVGLCVVSVAVWCLFEAYNRVLPGWQYHNLYDNLGLRFLGYGVAFATIMPGVFLTAQLIQSWGWFARCRGGAVRWSTAALSASVVVGAVACVGPLFAPESWRGYLWAAVWLGWVLLLEPFNYWRGLPSLYRDWENGDWRRTLELVVAGGICGLLWEFWNAFAHTRWTYVFPVPFGWEARYFEMPWMGFLGFFPFALELFVMFHFVAGLFTDEDRLGL
ncbi:MAG: hypothetical protein NZ483_00170 [Verrucomicrobiae bacterium]|nr:hypothetical protein [Verrucomicrobiae bacterium]MDW8343768.1 hypothetical protein [Verrucomicrobiae bacterium]